MDSLCEGNEKRDDISSDPNTKKVRFKDPEPNSDDVMPLSQWSEMTSSALECWGRGGSCASHVSRIIMERLETGREFWDQDFMPCPLSLNIDDRGSDLGKGENFSALNKKGKEIMNMMLEKTLQGEKV
ncbi:hypothetical protein Gotur_001666 [Gossypium turneri]